MDLSQIISNSNFAQAIQACAGFLFGKFCYKYGLLCARTIHLKFRTAKKYTISSFIGIAFLWFIAPIKVYLHTKIGGVVMMITILHFLNHARRNNTFWKD